MNYIAVRYAMTMKRTVFEKSLVAVLFVLVIVIFSLAERDTQKLFEKYNSKSTVDLPKKSVGFTAENSSTFSATHRLTRN